MIPAIKRGTPANVMSSMNLYGLVPGFVRDLKNAKSILGSGAVIDSSLR